MYFFLCISFQRSIFRKHAVCGFFGALVESNKSVMVHVFLKDVKLSSKCTVFS
jgi:hypothetical protein